MQHQRGLSCPVRPENRQTLARPDGQVDAVEGERPVGIAEPEIDDLGNRPPVGDGHRTTQARQATAVAATTGTKQTTPPEYPRSDRGIVPT